MQVNPLTISLLSWENPVGQTKPASDTDTFATVLRQALDQTNRLQIEADQVTEQYLAGDGVELHQVMLAVEKANLALQLTVQVRNKIVEAYQEVSRMQI